MNELLGTVLHGRADPDLIVVNDGRFIALATQIPDSLGGLAVDVATHRPAATELVGHRHVMPAAGTGKTRTARPAVVVVLGAIVVSRKRNDKWQLPSLPSKRSPQLRFSAGKPELPVRPFANEVNLAAIGDFIGIDPSFDRHRIAVSEVEGAVHAGVGKAKRCWFNEEQRFVFCRKEWESLAVGPWLTHFDLADGGRRPGRTGQVAGGLLVVETPENDGLVGADDLRVRRQVGLVAFVGVVLRLRQGRDRPRGGRKWSTERSSAGAVAWSSGGGGRVRQG